MTAQNLAQCLAFFASGLLKLRKRCFKRLLNGRIQSGARLGRFHRFRKLQNAPQGEKAVNTRRRRSEIVLHPLGEDSKIAEKSFIDRRLYASPHGPRYGQVGLKVPACKSFLDRLTSRQFQPVEAGRQTHPHLGALAIDGLHLPGDGNAIMLGVCAGETGHALQGHAILSGRLIEIPNSKAMV
ncbi:hypothetical protein HNR59_002425 [Aquamicrobium lusatiense]|uniref:Uncharacterized protein n=1 Tax=Aquamicrobium lusatiense TaxID=89772 RepID=A0A7W9VWA1_9HYPH|nr:hypothetical protein [Aquamicrobium lusatiense]